VKEKREEITQKKYIKKMSERCPKGAE